MFDRYSVDDTTDQEKSDAALAGITEENIEEGKGMEGMTQKGGHKREASKVGWSHTKGC